LETGIQCNKIRYSFGKRGGVDAEAVLQGVEHTVEPLNLEGDQGGSG
jgi:hypothetical protein